MEQDNKKRWARLSFGVSILTIIVGIIFIVIRKTRSEKEEPEYAVYDDIDTTPAKREHAMGRSDTTPAKRKYATGRSDRSIEELDIETPKNHVWWFVSHYDSPIEFVEYALSYADAYIVSSETHWIINKVANTSTSVFDMGDKLCVTVREYIEDEEMDGGTLGKGTWLFDYEIYKDNGDIVDVYDALDRYMEDEDDELGDELTFNL